MGEVAGNIGPAVWREVAAQTQRQERPERVEHDTPFAVQASTRAPDIPARFATATLQNFEARTPGLHAAARAVDRWVTAAAEGRPCMLALIGPPGTGKSHLLYAAARALHERQQLVFARAWYRLADELRYGGRVFANLTRSFEPHEVRAALYTERIFLLDEVRPTAGTSFDDMELTKLACHVYDHNLAMLITTNTSPLADVLGAAGASRFTQLVLDGEDWRQRKVSA